MEGRLLRGEDTGVMKGELFAIDLSAFLSEMKGASQGRGR